MDAPLAKGEHCSSLDPADASAMGVKTFGPVVAVALTLNFMVGTGCFGLPYAFSVAGIGLTSIFLIFGFLGALITMNYTLEAMARAEGVLSARSESPPLNRLTYRKTEFSAMSELFAGKTGYAVVQTVLVLYCIGTLWAYASIFASSVASVFHTFVLGDVCDVYAANASSGCLESYYGFMALFAVMSIALVLMDLGDQANIQKLLSGYRLLAFGIMLSTIAFKLSVDGADAISARLATRAHWAFNWQSFGAGFGPTLLALNCQYNMPAALQPLDISQKGRARLITYLSMTMAAFCYFFLGLLGALAFDDINPLASLMWSNFSGCGNGWASCPSGQPTVFGSLVHLIVVMFPVVNVTSSFPMVGLTVGGNILTSLPKSITAPLGPAGARNLSRLMAVLPPLLFAAIFKKLDVIFTYAGFLGFGLGLIIPAWFQVAGIQHFRATYGNTEAEKTPFSVPLLSSLPFATIFLGLTFLVTLVALYSLVGF
ncbi:hypothetical protein SPRG_05197 [Saprolegnia parasitica CBS 223.65]|uniref:Amino acid transporter transmembrane domain-containing protein n=1 Tax=Saprolegnia parasitica (strain CBS 223.65) TaxID=695850 RepID=A0A067CHL0_SAPPC|nr:hypothetical protein SPRG_05197 [Saprolegnia parasitica CBS 223.65]KDO30008.1 hypothetical protein SPRG_05197 [Saprolegnia parasitica CBS 223.65]|eukprot:XP_012199191.1 hypothetical protein SPRG_05197 [Saprolegnia parasitica CBS 223.65]